MNTPNRLKTDTALTRLSRFSSKYSATSSLIERNVPLEIKKSAEFWYLVRSDKRLLVTMFTAAWCGACKKVKPQINDMVKAYRSIVICSVDVDTLDDLAGQMDVSSTPTFVFYKNERKVGVVNGANVGSITALIEKHMDRMQPRRALGTTKDKTDLKDLIQKEKGLMIVYFSDKESSTCEKMSGKMEDLTGRYPDVVMIKVDVHEDRAAATKFDVTDVPIFFFFQNGKLATVVRGAKDGKIKENIEKYRKIDLGKCDAEMLVVKNAEDLRQVLSTYSKTLVLVYFFASYSEHLTHNLEKKLEDLAVKNHDFLICKFDIDDDQKTTDKLGITRLPTFYFYKASKKIHSIVGAKIDDVKKALKTYA